MKLETIVKKLGLDVRAGNRLMDREVRGCYIGDLLSDVMANANKDDLWITIQIHLNIVPVAVMKDLAGIVIANGKTPDDATLKKAEKEGIAVMISDLNSFRTAALIMEAGLGGGS